MYRVYEGTSKCVYYLCSVLDLNAFERQNKAEGLGMVSEEGTSKSLYSFHTHHFFTPNRASNTAGKTSHHSRCLIDYLHPLNTLLYTLILHLSYTLTISLHNEVHDDQRRDTSEDGTHFVWMRNQCISCSMEAQIWHKKNKKQWKTLKNICKSL